jgi:hypothetical protein
MRRVVRLPCIKCAAPSRKAAMCLPCYNRDRYQRGKDRAIPGGQGGVIPTLVKGWGSL